MSKSFFKRPVYNSLMQVWKIGRSFKRYLDRREIKKNNAIWNGLFNGKEVIQYPIGDQLKINLYKKSVFSYSVYKGFEKDETNYLKSTLKEGDIFIDIGSNIGWFSLIASKIVGEKGKVICFEPTPETYARLVENVKLNNLRNIDYRNVGLSDKKGELPFYVSENGYDAFNSFAPNQHIESGNTIQIPVSTLDFEIENIDKALIKLVKIDVEGWEKFVLYGGKDFFVKYNPIVMLEFAEENTFNAGYPIYEIYDIMESWGYAWYRMNNGKLEREKKNLHYRYVNLIAIKDK
jgi:FkbM family methyltransferase